MLEDRNAVSELFLQEAIEIGQQIVEQTGRARDGSVYWRGPAEVRGELTLRPLGPPLYAGSTGIALFLIALGVRTGRQEFAQLGREGLEPMLRELGPLLGDAERMAQIPHGIGGLAGLGSLVYALVRIGDFLEDSELYDFALDLSSLITQDRIEADSGLDVMLGSAGAILAFLALDEKRPTPNLNGSTPVQIAHACAHRVLAERDSDGIWERGGFCHGVAGLAAVFLRLYERVSRDEYLQAGLEALRIQDTLFDPERHDWRHNPDGTPTFKNSWCKGAPGVLLALCSVSEEDRLIRLQVAIDATGREELQDVDDVCCGTFGRVDALLHAYEQKDDSRALELAQRLAVQALGRKQNCENYSFHRNFENIFDPRFFPGRSGIGYTLLRLSEPHSLPSILALV